MTSPDEHDALAKILIWGFLAAMGGAVKYVSTVIRSPQSISHRRFAALLCGNMFISSFCGLMGYLLITTFTLSWEWHAMAAGLFGYLGTQGLDIVILTLRRKLDPNTTVSSVVPIPPK